MIPSRANNVNTGRAQAPASTRRRFAEVKIKRVPLYVQLTLMLFTASLPFEAADLGFASGSLSIARIGGLLFFASYFWYCGPLNRHVSIPPVSRGLRWFLVFFGFYLLNGFFGDTSFLTDLRGRLITFVQLGILFWFASDLLKDEILARNVALCFALACVVFALGTIFEIPGFYEDYQGEGRSTALGTNPNEAGQNMAIAGVILVGLSLSDAFHRSYVRLLLPTAAIFLLMAMAKTGSRGATLAFVAGCLLYALPQVGSRKLLSKVVLVALGFLGLGYFIYQNPELVERWQATYYESNTAGREDIFEVALSMIMERPIFGWQTVGGYAELGRRLGLLAQERDTHNLLLALLVEVGLVGTIPFVMGFFNSMRSAWIARRANLGLLPIAALIVVIVCGFSGNTLTWKIQWLLLALGEAMRYRGYATLRRQSPGNFSREPSRRRGAISAS